MPTLRIFSSFAIACCLACGGASSASETTPEGSGETAQTPSYEGAITGTASLGAHVFNNYCSSCHPGGQDGAGPALVTSSATPALVRQYVREGRGRMPSYNERLINNEDLEHLLAYLRDDLGMF